MTRFPAPASGRMRHHAARLATLALALVLGACATTGAPPEGAGTPAETAAAASAASPAGAASSAPALRYPPGSAPPPAEAVAKPVRTAPAAVTRLPGDAAGAPYDPIRPDEAVNLDDRGQHVDLWARVRAGFGMADLDTELVRGQEEWYASRPAYVQRMTERGGRYLFHIVEEVERRGLPSELALLPFIESAFNPQALSTAKASGIWQFMPGTGKDFDLRQNLFRDDRRDVLASTRAALDYLSTLHRTFGDWHLALAAYNWGQGNVARAIARNRNAGLPTDYLSLRMPEETRQYVPKLQAVKNIVARPEAFGLALPEIQNHPFFLAVPIERDIDVETAARLAELPVEQFRQLNPQMNKPVILAAGTPQVLLPYDNAATFARNLARHHGPLASWTAWRAPRTMRPAEAAREVGMTESRLREVNRIPPRTVVKAGSTLLVPRAAHKEADVPEQLADTAMLLLAPDAPPLRRVAFRAGKKGDSVAAVARRYRTSAANVARWNGVAAGARFKPGAQVVVYVPPRAARPARAAAKPGTRAAAKAAPRSSARPAARANAKAPVRRAAQPAAERRASGQPTAERRAAGAAEPVSRR